MAPFSIRNQCTCRTANARPVGGNTPVTAPWGESCTTNGPVLMP